MSHRFEYSHPQGHHAYPDQPAKSKSKSSKYTPAKIESDLRRTLSFLSRVLQNEFLNPPAGQSHRSPPPSAREYGYTRKDGGDMTFDEILLKGRKKLEKLVMKYRELNPTSSSSGAAEHSSRSRNTAYNEQRERSAGTGTQGGQWQQADEIEEVESVRSSRHRSSNSRAQPHHHHHAPRAPSPPRYTSRGAHDWAGVNPEYHSTPFTSDPYYDASHAHGGQPTKRKGTGLSFDKLNLPALISHAGLILGIIEKVLVMKSGGSRGHRSGSGGNLQTAVKVVRMIVALSEGLGFTGRPDANRRHTY